MRISSPRLRRLDDALAALPAESDAMLLSDLDGYLAGVIVCPDPIPTAEWMPLVWDPDGDVAPFADEREAQWYGDLVMGHHDAIVRALGKRGQGAYVPFLEVDRPRAEILWELWIEGFAAAMTLRPGSWDRIAESGDAGAAAALAGMMSLVQIAGDELIAQWMSTLHRWRSEHGAAIPGGPGRPLAARIGRNDPCPCGSGNKHKKCCGLG